ncbi:enoyl-CoA hydratase/isomerase family protein [Rhodococcus sp. BP-349]|uniref:enoyl-CoA hydratase/isomerase family protein n=1 Tax=unclassified Rhodococcus (in: high G+C Gram-positive bacteria) TaxID=192944 RepID=UPI001C9B5A4C|nr:MULTISPECIES: enoyl-CoA hydratase-related protein [unclassified Rhodococcus (in: high G+C Gram-positive bacteria)]MBY6537938.1 enoyl-CoA hydratase/isomerase family protein [Rhodococcus sp. BP-363]MBY6542275.1 enoyl-CoA hydratase/isomerase family protein [Rhodococcus sp. BP-369]MBY6561505.1 enoyl-CoA hydratase/isomerase family protein [Rhodococcus sp. BP-370]MBY6575797.1 enoyl-CoA hydratase/isomerase family protein [Rhodococcus sp. BP-364]MBY6585098.1 enoyl-CoA hydratase/isomerase family pro
MSTEPTGHRYERDGDIVTVVIDHGPINIVDPNLIESLIAHLPSVLDDPTVRCVVLRGKDRIFVGGANLRVMHRLDADTYREMRRWVVVQRLLELAPKPVIAALNGHALGGGAELSLACDLRILHADALFGFPETDLGIFPGAGGSQRLPRLVGPHRAKRFIVDATRFTSEQALREGLVDLVAGDDFEEVVVREARRLAQRPTATIGLVKSAIDRGWDLPIDEAMSVEEQHVLANLDLDDAAEGIGAFLDKRTARFEGR